MTLTEINSIEDIQLLIRAGEENWKQYGEVKAVYHDGLLLFNYTAIAQYQKRWNFFERVSRGLIMDAYSGEVVARPFDKFFNFGEREESIGEIDHITEKMDGSLGILYWNKGYKIATRGSFTSDQAIWATEQLEKYDLNYMSPDLTLLFEIIYPENRIVVNYGDRKDLVLLAARNRFTGVYVPHEYVEQFAKLAGFNTPKTYNFTDFKQMIVAASALSANEEGWVVKTKDGERIKFKGEAYVLAHRVATGVTFKNVLEAIEAGVLDNIINGVPDEFLGQIKEWKFQIEREIATTRMNVNGSLAAAPQGSQKDFAMWVKKYYPDDKAMQAYLFAARAGKDITGLIYKLAFDKVENKL